MSLKMFVSRALAVQSSVTAGALFATGCNLFYGKYMIGYDWVSAITVGAIIGGIIACGLGLVDFMTYYAGRTKDLLAFNLTGLVCGITVYNCNVAAHMNMNGWTIRGAVISLIIGLICGNIYTLACWMVKRISW